MRCALAVLAVFSGFGSAAAAPVDLIPMGPGSKLFWVSAYDGGTDRFYETLIAQGDDFQIFRNDGEWSEGGVADHFAVFSGLHVTSCDSDMPSLEDRQKLAEFWPLQPGETVTIDSDDGAEYKVGDAREFFLMGKSWPAHSVSGTYFGDEPSEDSLIILADMALTVSIRWEDLGLDTATLITPSTSVASTPIDTDLIGNCASLLNIETDKN